MTFSPSSVAICGFAFVIFVSFVVNRYPLGYFFILSQDLGYISSYHLKNAGKETRFLGKNLVSHLPNTDLVAQSETVGRLLNGLIASTERRQ